EALVRVIRVNMNVPTHALGGDLIWWRESPIFHTAVTLWGGDRDLRILSLGASEAGDILLRLHDPAGKPLASWTEKIRPGIPLTVDSRNHPGVVEEGVLAIFSLSRN